jgi:hypothetical protein
MKERRMASSTLFEKYLKETIAKYEERVKKIREDPDPRLAKSNVLLYEAIAEQRKQDLMACRSGKPISFAGLLLTIPLESMGLQVIDLFGFAQIQSGQRAKKYLDAVEKAGYRSGCMCDILITEIGMVITGDLGVPACIATSNAVCEAASLANAAIGHYLKHNFSVPYFHIDHYEEDTVNPPIDYVKVQLEEMIDYFENEVPKAKFNEEDCMRREKNIRWGQDVLLDIWKYCQEVPCPVSALEAFRIPDVSLADLPIGREYFESYREEIKERVQKGWSAVGEEKARVLWCVSGPFFANLFTPLEEKGISVPAVLMDTSEIIWGDRDGKIDWNFKGRKLTCLEQCAELFSKPRWMGPARKWIYDIIEYARIFRVDGIVYFLQIGCPTTQTAAGITRQAVEKELGIPFLTIQGYQMFEDKFDLKEVKERLSEFGDIVIANKTKQV